jgi:2-C-methyl-D-erythritol 4-phosphate cytidylyltransferase
MRVSAILLAGGIGSRMQVETPKQYLTLGKKTVAQYSFDLLLSLPQIEEIIVVCDPAYQNHFQGHCRFAPPGNRRQDSLFNGFQLVSNDLVLIHDAARPFMTPALIERVVAAARHHGAATCGMPLKFTVKEIHPDHFVARTPNRDLLFEIQTPQAIRRDLLAAGLKLAIEKNLTVTDDVSLVELLGHPVKIVEGNPFNLKITNPDDLHLAERLLKLSN